MTKIQDGYQNEFLFVLEFNNKKIKELNPLLREVIDDIFPNVDEETVLKAWRNHVNNQKGDIIIRIGEQYRSNSIKKGSRNSVHLENIEAFKVLLKESGIDDKIIYYYELFHYGIDRFNNKKILSSEEYCKKNKRKIKKLNKALSTLNIESIVDRFILRGNNGKYRVEGIILGTPKDFLWINRRGVLQVIKDSIKKESSTIHIGCLYIPPLNRCINGNKKYEWCRDYVQIKWYSLFDDIIKYKNDIVQKNN